MPNKIITSVLWKRVMDATVDTLKGQSRGQYHIELGQGDDVENFFEGCDKQPVGSKGGFNIVLPIHGTGGESPVDETTIPIDYAGDESARKTWRISKQRPETAYPLWREERAFPNGVGKRDYIILARDASGAFHARWVNTTDFNRLPEAIRSEMIAKDFGVLVRPNSISSPKVQNVIDQLKEKTNVLLYGPPGTGKTHIMQEVANNFNSSSFVLDDDKERECFSFDDRSFNKVRSSFITFHQSYSYEEFVIGMRPDSESEKLLSLSPVPGKLLELSEYSRQPDSASLLLIDEVNRGNVSRIFGEFITLMEPGKRLGVDGEETPSTIKINLPYVKESTPVKIDVDGTAVSIPNPFSLPASLYTLASMNSVDKSVAPLDAAIRRRFQIFHLEPDFDELRQQFKLFDSSEQDIENIKELSIELLEYINESISFFRGKDFQLGHWYLSSLCKKFSNADECKETLVDVWLHKIIPQLEELFHGRTEQLSKILKLDQRIAKSGDPIEIVIPDAELEQLGASPFFRHRDAGENIQNNIEYMERICDFSLSEPSETGDINGSSVEEGEESN